MNFSYQITLLLSSTSILFLFQDKEKSDSVFKDLQDKSVKISELTSEVDRLNADIGILKQQVEEGYAKVAEAQREVVDVRDCQICFCL